MWAFSGKSETLETRMKEAAVASQSCHVFEGPSGLFPRLSEEQACFRQEHYELHKAWKRGLVDNEEFRRSRRRWTAIRRAYRKQLVVYRHREGLKHKTLVTHMEVGGVQTEDRSKWEEGASQHATSKYEDEEMRIVNNSCIEELRGRAEWAASLDPSRECPITMALVLRARSRLKEGRAVGADGISCTVLKSLAWTSLRVILCTFQALYRREVESPESWRLLRVSLMLKDAKIRRFAETRALAVSSTFSKWYAWPHIAA